MKDTKDIRLTNITKLARIITGDTHTTRRELAKQLGLSLMTVTTLVDQLLKLQLIVTLPQKSESKKWPKGGFADIECGPENHFGFGFAGL